MVLTLTVVPVTPVGKVLTAIPTLMNVPKEAMTATAMPFVPIRHQDLAVNVRRVITAAMVLHVRRMPPVVLVNTNLPKVPAPPTRLAKTVLRGPFSPVVGTPVVTDLVKLARAGMMHLLAQHLVPMSMNVQPTHTIAMLMPPVRTAQVVFRVNVTPVILAPEPAVVHTARVVAVNMC